jgi:hypothetical protein
MIIMRRAQKFGAVAAVTAGLLVGLASPAAADSSVCAYASCAGKATFVSLGEHLKVYDNVADGYSVVVINYRQDLGGPFYGWNHTGAGTVTDYNLSMPEGDWIQYQVCLGVYSSRTILTSTCGGWVVDYA